MLQCSLHRCCIVSRCVAAQLRQLQPARTILLVLLTPCAEHGLTFLVASERRQDGDGRPEALPEIWLAAAGFRK